MSVLCRFCEINSGNITALEDQLIMDNDNYFSIASIGALVDGWILVIPKDHICSMKDLYNRGDFFDFVNQILVKMWTHYNTPVILFEHGPNKMNSKTSCGTNHAHLHIVPYDKSLLHEMVATGLCWEKCFPSEIASKVGDNEYLFYSELSINNTWQNSIGYLHILDTPISQFFRKLIAQQLNCTEKYDYKKFQHIDVAIFTQQLLTSSK
jgi:diadenosine tetraphosphate (Ap4A) HIT family hydrolase